jgi:hypothetical protein
MDEYFKAQLTNANFLAYKYFLKLVDPSQQTSDGAQLHDKTLWTSTPIQRESSR